MKLRTPTEIRMVSAASGPYAAELRASRPKTGIPAAGSICSFVSSSEESGRPKRTSRIDFFGGGVVTCSLTRKSFLPQIRFRRSRLHKLQLEVKSYAVIAERASKFIAQFVFLTEHRL